MNYSADDQIERNKRKHITLTIQEKLDIISYIDAGQSRQFIATKYGVGKTTVHDIYKRREKIREFAQQKNTDLAKRRRLDVNMDSGKNVEKSNPEEFEYKEIVEEETLVENFDHEDFDPYSTEQEYEIVYEPNLVESTSELMMLMRDKSQSELPVKLESTSAKRKSKTLTLKEKYDILKQLESGESVPKICQKYEIGRTTVYDFLKNKEKIIEFIEKSCNENRRTFKKSNYPGVENKMKAWCQTNEVFTKQQFFEKCKQFFAQEKQKSPSQFGGSWSWCKRFFDRHPEFKRKLISSRNGEAPDLTEFSFELHNKSNSFEEDIIDKNGSIPDNILTTNYEANTMHKRHVKYLNLNEKRQVIDSVSEGSSITTVADRWNVSKSTVYEILKRQSDINSNSKINSERKVIKSPKFPDLETALIEWCLSQETFPNHVLISDKAMCLFDSLKLEGNFNPTTVWVKKFIQRHPDLNQMFQQKSSTFVKNELHQNDIIAENENNLTSESLEFIDSEFLKLDNEDEYIVEELEHENPNESELIRYEEIIQSDEVYDPSPEEEISDEEALKSLKILIKYSAKKGHDEISNLLREYKNILEEENLS